MKTIKCRECNIEKELSEFYIVKNKIKKTCKKCTIKCINNTNRTKSGLVHKIYNSQKWNSKMRGHSSPTYSKDELHDWLYSQQLYHELYDNWKRLNFQKDYIPSVDRKDDTIGYAMDNIRLMTWRENLVYSHIDTMNGTGSSKRYKSVDMYTKDGVFLKSFFSSADAGREVGSNHSNIIKCCKHKYKSAGGYVWEYTGNTFTQRNGKRNRKILQIDIETKDILNIFNGTYEAGNRTGVSSSSIWKVCENKKGYKTAGGFSWEYENNEEQEFI